MVQAKNGRGHIQTMLGPFNNVLTYATTAMDALASSMRMVLQNTVHVVPTQLAAATSRMTRVV